MADPLLASLREVVGAAHVLTDPDTTRAYEVDWTGRFVGRARAVVRPGTTEQVGAVLARCSEAGAAVVPQGGNTGLVGGGVPLHGEVLVSLRRLSSLGPVDRRAGQVTAGAGVTLGALQTHAEAAGWSFGVDLGARDSATVGGMVATNAGGTRLIRYGPMRHQVLGVEAVLADGRTLRRLTGLLKDNTGYDLAGLVTGSEGTLAVVTQVRLRLVPPRPQRAVAVLGVESLERGLDVVAELRMRLEALEAVEAFFSDGLALVRERLRLPAPLRADRPVYLLVECAEPAPGPDPADALAEALAAAGLGDDDAVLAVDPAGRAALWRLREGHTEAINALGAEIGPPHKLDVTVPTAHLAEFAARVRPAVAALAPASRTFLFGHLADGNLHVNVVGLAPDDERVDDAVLRLVVELGGSISAEHGIGTAKRRWLALDRSPTELAVFTALRGALDPGGVLNPAVLVPPADPHPISPR
jgi:FAD/FMN-containing dehydrogenase